MARRIDTAASAIEDPHDQMPGVEALVWIYPPLTVDVALAGTAYNVRIAGLDMVLTLPCNGAEHYEFPQPEQVYRSPTFPVPPVVQPGPDPRKRFHMKVQVPDHILAVDVVRLHWIDPAFEATISDRGVINDLSNEVWLWLETARDWIALWHRRPREPDARGVSPKVRAVLVDHPEAGAFVHGGVFPHVVRQASIVDEDQMRGAFAAASNGRKLPLEWALLSEARYRSAEENYRFSVICSCSAAEVALSGFARDQLLRQGRSDKQAEKAVAGAPGVMRLYRFAAGFTSGLGATADSVRFDLAQPRNKAAHAGELLDQNTAAKAFQTAHAVVIDLVSIPSPADILKECDDGELMHRH
jgi:hypothetical protein